MNVPEEPKLKEITGKLCEILRIQDWDVSVSAVSGYEFNQKTGLECTYDGASCRRIRLNTARVYLNKETDADWYETLVHELIHIQTFPMEHCATAYFEHPQSYFDDMLENMVEKQAQVFCKIYPVGNFDKV
jgi:hypothetical protein